MFNELEKKILQTSVKKQPKHKTHQTEAFSTDDTTILYLLPRPPCPPPAPLTDLVVNK